VRGDARMIVAEDAPVDVERSFIGLFGESPLLFACINLREIIEQRGNVGLGLLAGFEDNEASLV